MNQPSYRVAGICAGHYDVAWPVSEADQRRIAARVWIATGTSARTWPNTLRKPAAHHYCRHRALLGTGKVQYHVRVRKVTHPAPAMPRQA